MTSKTQKTSEGKETKAKPAPKGKTKGTKLNGKSKTTKKTTTPSEPVSMVELPRLQDAAFAQAQLPYDQIEIHPDVPNGREPGTPTDDLEEGILELGLETPITVWRQKDDSTGKYRFFLLCGWRRHEAIRNLRAKDPGSFHSVPVSIFDGTLQQAILHNISENAQRRNPNAVEYGDQILRLIKISDGKLSQAEIARQLGKSAAWVSVSVKFAKGPEAGVTKQLRAAIQTGQVGFNQGRMIAGKAPDVQIRFIKSLEKAQRSGQKEKAKEELEGLEGKPPKPPRQRSRPLEAVLLRIEEFNATNLDELTQSMLDIRSCLNEKELELVRNVLKLSHHYGQVKALTWASGAEINWKKAKPPFEVASENVLKDGRSVLDKEEEA